MKKTINKSVSFSGIGLHSGEPVDMTLRPAEGGGVVFWLPYNYTVSASYEKVSDTKLCTMLVDNDKKVSTTEHLMAALASFGITDIIIELNGPEVPIADGSSKVFVDLINDVGIKDLGVEQKAIKIEKPVELKTPSWEVGLYPADHFSIEFEIEFDDFGKQTFTFNPSTDSFEDIIAPARTFGFKGQIEALTMMGLIQGGSLDNAIVYDDGKVLNEGGLRFIDECVRHKVLDTIGDLYLAGAPIIGKFVGKRSGHLANNLLLHKLLDDSDNYRWV